MPPSYPRETDPLLASASSDDACGNYLVELRGPDDPLSPQNSMSKTRKWLSASFLGAMTFAATFSSAVFAAVGPSLAQEMHTTPEQIALATSFFVFGFAAGPVIMGPASEVYGRKAPLFLGYLAFVLCQIPVALAEDFRSVLLWRFLGGVASSGSPAIVGGYLADFLRPVERGIAIAIFAATTLVGPPVGAIVGAVLLDSPLGWRWAAWLSMIMGTVFGVMAFLIVPETYMPVLLKRKAQQLRFETGNWAWHAKLEEKPVTVTHFITQYLTRPFSMLFQEPILILMTLYVSFTFGMIYFVFAVRIGPPFPIIALLLADRTLYRHTRSASSGNVATHHFRAPCPFLVSFLGSSSGPSTSPGTQLMCTPKSSAMVARQFLRIAFLR